MKINNNYKAIETKWYNSWLESSSFDSDPKSKNDPYCIMMPPPNVTGSLHIGHALTFTLQDVLSRFYRMQGKDVLWQPGTDHAGIATQMVVERMLAKKNITRRELGRKNFLKKVWEWKNLSGNKITDQLKALGCSPDWKRERFTMDEGLSKAVIQVFVNLYNAGLIYKDKRLVNWDTELRTAISDLEVEQKEVESNFWYIKYPLENNNFITIATTRPETMLGDTAVAVNPKDERYKKFIGLNVTLPFLNKKIPIIADEYTEPEKGSGAVKITPAHDFNDFEVGKRHNLEVVNILNSDGTINENGTDLFKGLDRFEARKKIIEILENKKLIFKTEKIINTLPYGDRSGSIIEPWLMDQWYVNAKVLAKSAVDSVKSNETSFVPRNWEKTFFDWMNNIQPWCISRQLWWGHRIPAWYGPDKKVFVAMDVKEANKSAESFYGKKVILHQDEDVLDTWFSSALWPFSTLGWPENKPELKKYYPTNVLVTGFDIIFFWVARMMMMGIYFMNGKSPFKEVYIHALVRDEKGQKMSKSKGNVLDPVDLINKYGADALRFTLCSMAAQGRDIKLSEKRIAGYRNFSTKVLNACNYLKINSCFEIKESNLKNIKMSMNVWILNLSNSLNDQILNAIKNYKYNEYCDLVYHFVWRDFCDWYIEFMKAVFNSKSEQNKIETRYVSKIIMTSILKFLHPLMPFVTEEFNKNFVNSNDMLIKSCWPEKFSTNKIFQKDNVNDLNQLEIPEITKIISEIRAIRVERNLSYKNKLNLHIKSSQNKRIFLSDENIQLISFIGKVDNINLLTQEKELDKDLLVKPINDFLLGFEILASFNAGEEKVRFRKEMKLTEEEIQKIENMLSNNSFLAKAPKQVVDKYKKQLNELINKKKEIQNLLNC